MHYNRHSNLEGKHAFLGASKWHWLNYDPEKLAESWTRHMAIQRGTDLHALACQCIKLGVKLPSTKQTLNMYVNDAIGYRMKPEQPLYFSDNCFGTADTIAFRRKLLRIHDLKTGVTPASIHQLEIYAALFCLEYQVKPASISFELRIYQNDDVDISEPKPEVIQHVMDKIVTFDEVIDKLQAEGGSAT